MVGLNDIELLREYLDGSSEAAFAELVQQHINLIYSVALRYTGNSHDAQDVTQAVFVILAKKAASLRHRTNLTGWLYETTRFTSNQLLRTRARQQAREQEAYMQSTVNDPETEGVWRQLAPLLEEAMTRLNEKERAMLALHYFENKSGAETAALMGVNEWAARKCTHRAVEKLRKFFSKRGVAIPAAVLMATIAANSVQAAPVTLAQSVTAVAMTKGVAASGSTLTLIKGALKVMAWTKAKTAIVAGVVALLVAGTTTVAVVEVKKSHAEEIESYFANWNTVWSATSIDEVPLPQVVLLRPSKYVNKGNYILTSLNPGPDSRIMRRAASLPEILGTAYDFSPEQMVLPANLPQGQYDMLLTTTSHSREDLQAELKRQFGLTAHVETRDRDVMVVRVSNPEAPGLKVSSIVGMNIETQADSVTLRGYTMDDAAHVLGTFFNMPVDNETGLTGKYDIDFHWNTKLKGDALRKDVMNSLHEQLGLELTPDKQPVKMLVVERKKL